LLDVRGVGSTPGLPLSSNSGTAETTGGLSGARFDALLSELSKTLELNSASSSKEQVTDKVQAALVAFLQQWPMFQASALQGPPEASAKVSDLVASLSANLGLNLGEQNTLLQLSNLASQKTVGISPPADPGQRNNAPPGLKVSDFSRSVVIASSNEDVPGTSPGPKGGTPEIKVEAPGLSPKMAVNEEAKPVISALVSSPVLETDARAVPQPAAENEDLSLLSAFKPPVAVISTRTQGLASSSQEEAPSPILGQALKNVLA
jgi:hypothetical protein